MRIHCFRINLIIVTVFIFARMVFLMNTKLAAWYNTLTVSELAGSAPVGPLGCRCFRCSLHLQQGLPQRLLCRQKETDHRGGEEQTCTDFVKKPLAHGTRYHPESLMTPTFWRLKSFDVRVRDRCIFLSCPKPQQINHHSNHPSDTTLSQ